jgi:hypothetical protein
VDGRAKRCHKTLTIAKFIMQNLIHSTTTTQLHNSFRRFICCVAFATAAHSASAAPSQPVTPPCSPFGGRFVITQFQFDSATTAHAEADVWSNGEVIAHASAHYFNIDQKGNGVTQMNASHTLTFGDGSTIVTLDEIRLHSENQDPLWARINSRLYVVSGTGVYAGATGLLITHGEANLVTLEGGIDFDGQICAPEAN